MSNIHVAVGWTKPTAFAGEEIECKITFKNVSRIRNTSGPTSPSPWPQDHGISRERWKNTLPSPRMIDRTRQASLSSVNTSKVSSRGHRPTLSLNAPVNTSQVSVPKLQITKSTVPNGTNYKHKRSVSIVSIGGENSSTGPKPQGDGSVLAAVRPHRRHERAVSLQVLPRRPGPRSTGPPSAPLNPRAVTIPSPLFRASTFTANSAPNMNSAFTSRSLKPLNPSWTNYPASEHPQKSLYSASSEFKFPPSPSPANETSIAGVVSENENEPAMTSVIPSGSPWGDLNGVDHVNPISRVISSTSTGDTPRSSGDFYSMSNKSNESLASEYLLPNPTREAHGPAYSRRPSQLRTAGYGKAAETLMMGYVQLTGSFTLDGSLVNQAPFEAVKRKGVVGGQGNGGVVGVKNSKRDSSLFGALGWSNIGESLGGLLGGEEISTIKEMKGAANAKSIPILSTPQSILFVDLHLRPGESRSFRYRHALPRGVPPSHKGRAIKISYNLVVGTQRAKSTAQQHQIRRVEVPFKVLPGINGQGEILGHNLMNPHIILQDNAITSTLESSSQEAQTTTKLMGLRSSASSAEDFVSYVGNLLDNQHQDSSFGLSSPTDTRSGAWATPFLADDDHLPIKDAIDLAIVQSNSTALPNRRANRFEIQRSGNRVATIMLTRPAYRLGEPVFATIDFEGAVVPCYSLHISLESSEIVDPAIALRSKASIQRATRRIHATSSEKTLFSKRAFFCSKIPTNSTPEFATTGVSLEWTLRFEFVTKLADDDYDYSNNTDALLEEVGNDERGQAMAAVQGLPCESIDIAVPLRVYGSILGFDEQTVTDDYPI